MRCLFCKEDSSASRSVEHIVPQSLGNTTSTLPPGVICDSCNNYFARKVEKPFLESMAILALRFHQVIPNKKGRVPPLLGMAGGGPAIVHRHLEGPFVASVVTPYESAERILKQEEGAIILPSPSDVLDNPPIVARFLAKAALETMAQRLVDHAEGLSYLVDEAQLDPIRDFARRGRPASWPYHSRRIYDGNQNRAMPDGTTGQVVWESDLLQTPFGEWYFILAIFGLELSINLGGPEIDGYLQWLQEHHNVSPLYYGKNEEAPEP
jgi:hypothetical protein